MAKILIIDDDQAVVNSVGILLRGEGHEVISEVNPERAAAHIKGARLDLIITDIKMAPMDGMELIKMARKIQPSAPIIVISAFTSEETIKLSHILGCKTYIKKPFRVEQVLDAVSSLLK